MTTNHKTRFIAVTANGKTQEMGTKSDALYALADGDADHVLVMHATADGNVNIIKWTLEEAAP